jgi:hypothetical protein
VNLVDRSTTENQFQVFPNPNQGEFFIQSSISAELSMHDLVGREVRRIKVTEQSNTRVTVHDLQNGIYFLKGPEGVKEKRIIICR